jgi:hypothetical protein
MNTTEPNEVKYNRLQESASPDALFQGGFYSAINYLNEWITALGENPGIEFNADTFNSFVDTFVGPRSDNNADVIDEHFFDGFKFHEDEIDLSVYPIGSMPNENPPPDHIPIGSGINGIPRSGNSKRAVDWLKAMKP